MSVSLVTALALSAQLVAPALPRLSLRDSTLTYTLAPVRDNATRQQAAPQPSKRGRIVTAAIIGGVIGSVMGATIGRNADVCGGRSRRTCAALGGTFGATIGALAARGK